MEDNLGGSVPANGIAEARQLEDDMAREVEQVEQAAEKLDKQTTQNIGKATISAEKLAEGIEEKVKKGDVNEAYDDMMEARDITQEEDNGE